MKSTLLFKAKMPGASILLLFALSSFFGAYRAEAGEAGLPDALIGGSGFAVDLPIYHVGFELITEGTTNYSIQRTMRNIFPFDLDFTVFVAWGYTGDKINIKVQDSGDSGDRIFGVALAQAESRMTPAWGTLYSSGSQNSFEISLPVFQPGAVIYFISGFFAPSTGSDAYSYTITVNFPQ